MICLVYRIAKKKKKRRTKTNTRSANSRQHLLWKYFLSKLQASITLFHHSPPLTNITSSECDHQLFWLVALWAWFWHNIFIQGLQGPLKAGELHHGVGDLSRPQWNQSFVETTIKVQTCLSYTLLMINMLT